MAQWRELMKPIYRKISKMLSVEDSEQWKIAGQDLESSLKFIDGILIELGSNFEAIEKQLQRYESEIRKHIRTEQQIKLYAESVQQKYEESESTRLELLENTKKMINVKGLKKDNEAIFKKLQTSEDENKMLSKKLAEFEDQLKKLNFYPDRLRDQQVVHLSLLLTKSTISKYSTIDQVSKANKNQISEKTEVQLIFNTPTDLLKLQPLRKFSLTEELSCSKAQHPFASKKEQPRPANEDILKQHHQCRNISEAQVTSVVTYKITRSQQRIGIQNIINQRKVSSRQENQIIGKKWQSVDQVKLFALQKKYLQQNAVNGARTLSNQDYMEYLESGI